MTLSKDQHSLASCAVFCPQSKAPEKRYLDDVIHFLKSRVILAPLLQTLSSLEDIWALLVESNLAISKLDHGLQYVRNFSAWVRSGDSSKVVGCMSGIVSLPLLVVIQISQYFQYLEACGASHAEFLAKLGSNGGIQGYCGGLPTAIAIACSGNDADLVSNCATAIRLALVIGLYGELADDGRDPGPTTLVVRLKQPGQEAELIRRFPGLYISAITDPKTISVVGPAGQLAKFQEEARRFSLLTQEMHIRGKVHNPENKDLAQDLCQLCTDIASLQLPSSRSLLCGVRSNETGKHITRTSLTNEIIMVILTSKCEWYRLLEQVAADLETASTRSHEIALFGIGDCVSLAPFHQRNLQITKIEVQSLTPKQNRQVADNVSRFKYPETAVAIIGASCRLPGANNLDEFWTLLASGASQHKEVDKDRVDIHGSYRASQDKRFVNKRKFFANFIDNIDDFDHEFFGISPKEAMSMDPQQRILLELAFQALDSSGYLNGHVRESGDNVGCFIGASFAEYLDNTNAHPPTAYTSTGTIRAFLSGRISHVFGWTGPSEILDTACSSSLVAINRACKSLSARECSLALAGGVNVMTGVNNFLDLAKAGFLSPSGQCKPFDAAADGYCRSEGGGLVVLKKLASALSDGDHILGIIPGIAHNQGGLSTTITLPHSAAQCDLYRAVLRQACLDPHQITFVEAHGTGTPAGDPLEMESIRQVFGGSERHEVLSVGSLKGSIGHAETAAGVASLLKVLTMIWKGSIPPQASHKIFNPQIAPIAPHKMEIASKLTVWDSPTRIASVNSYGAAGSNCALICCAGPERQPQKQDSRTAEAVNFPTLISAASETSLRNNVQSICRYLKQSREVKPGDLSFTLSKKRKLHHFMCAMPTKDTQKLLDLLPNVQTCFFEARKDLRKVVLAFGGQNKRIVDMPRSIYEAYPQFRRYVDECDNIIRGLGYSSIVPSLFETKPLNDIVALQCGTFVKQYATAACWIDGGLEVSAVIGHSFGELAAMVVAGILSLPDGLKLIASRAALMTTTWGPEKGAMLGLKADRKSTEDVISAMKSSSFEVEIACFNAPSSHVIVGGTEDIEQVQNLLKSDIRFSHIKAQRVDVTHGFHSHLTASILVELNQLAASLDWSAPRIPIETCTTGNSNHVDKSHPAKHAREPVYFAEAVRRIEANLGPCLWLEAGVNSQIITMTKTALSAPEKHSFQGLACVQSGDVSQELSNATIGLWREGIPVTYWSFLPRDQHPHRQIWLPPYQFQRTQHWIPNIDRAIEAQRSISGQDISSNFKKSLKLVSRKAMNVFEIHQSSQRFGKIVSGHAVRGRALCPASMYLESALMALQLAESSIKIDAIEFVDTCFLSPLGIDPYRQITIELKVISSMKAWSFTVQSYVEKNSVSKKLLHTTGQMIQNSRPDFKVYERLVGSRVEGLRNRYDLDSLNSKRAYKLFSRVVQYAEFFQAISHITFDDSDAVAQIEPPETAIFGCEESSSMQNCDSITIDAFVQVLGLLVNSGNLTAENDVYVATSLGSLSTLPTHDFCNISPSTVYVKFTTTNEHHIVGDIFAFDQSGKVFSAILGTEFTKLAIPKLEQLLEIANQKIPSESIINDRPQSSQLSNTSVTDSQKGHDLTPASSIMSASPSVEDAERSKHALQIISDISQAPVEVLISNTTLQQAGLDSLSTIELKSDLEKAFDVEIDDNSFSLESTVETVLSLLGLSSMYSSKPNSDNYETMLEATSSSSPNMVDSSSMDLEDIFDLSSPMESLNHFCNIFKKNAEAHGFTDYCVKVAPKQEELMLAYICEAFEALGLKIATIAVGERVSTIEHAPLHSKVVNRFLDILEKHKILVREDDRLTRGGGHLPTRRSSDIHADFMCQFPAYASEARLMSLTGPNLADCLVGKTDAVKLLFQGAAAQMIMEDYYTNSPMLSTLTEQMVGFIHGLLPYPRMSQSTLRILEVGAGFGGTTARLVDSLLESGIKLNYTFTDISPSLVNSAKKKFSKYSCMNYQVLNMESEVPGALQGTFDIVIGTNCVHATINRTTSIKRLKTLLNGGGFIVLSEVTQMVDWYDIVFGLLEGWWLATDGSEYPLQTAQSWSEAFERAGFDSNKIAYSVGFTPEANMQRLLVASNRHTSSTIRSDGNLTQPEIKSLVYKETEGTKIAADVYLPRQAPSKAMPVALMIHGGGHMTLSRKAIRPRQTAHLLRNHVLPISIDYRLCPEINLIDGPIQDVIDAFKWIKDGSLNEAIETTGVRADVDRVVVVGWSSGGQLAMTMAWTSRKRCIDLPVAILSFYGPTDFESGDLDSSRKHLPVRKMPTHQILSSLAPKPITSYTAACRTPDERHLGWLRSNDPRSELVLSLFKDGHGLPLMLNGIDNENPESWHKTLDPELIASISPLSQVRRGNYRTPTFLVHGTEDEIVPFHTAKIFYGALKEMGVDCGISTVEGARHVHDFQLGEEDSGWMAGAGIGYAFLFEALGLGSAKPFNMGKDG